MIQSSWNAMFLLHSSANCITTAECLYLPMSTMLTAEIPHSCLSIQGRRHCVGAPLSTIRVSRSSIRAECTCDGENADDRHLHCRTGFSTRLRFYRRRTLPDSAHRVQPVIVRECRRVRTMRRARRSSFEIPRGDADIQVGFTGSAI